MLHLNKYLSLIFHPGFNRKDGVVVYVQESIEYEVICTKANLCYKVIKATNERNQCFVVVCMNNSTFFKQSLLLLEREEILNDSSIPMGFPIFILDDMNTPLLKQNKLSSFFSNLLQYNGMTEPLATAT